jgi:hypothetical protein
MCKMIIGAGISMYIIIITPSHLGGIDGMHGGLYQSIACKYQTIYLKTLCAARATGS